MKLLLLLLLNNDTVLKTISSHHCQHQTDRAPALVSQNCLPGARGMVGPQKFISFNVITMQNLIVVSHIFGRG